MVFGLPGFRVLAPSQVVVTTPELIRLGLVEDFEAPGSRGLFVFQFLQGGPTCKQGYTVTTSRVK